MSMSIQLQFIKTNFGGLAVYEERSRQVNPHENWLFMWREAQEDILCQIISDEGPWTMVSEAVVSYGGFVDIVERVTSSGRARRARKAQ